MTDGYPRPQQYGGLASELRQTCLTLLKTIAAANESHSPILHQDIDTCLQQIQMMLEVSADLRYISLEQKDTLTIRVDELGRMNGGWGKAFA
jgi:hypothetical protein